MKLKFLAKDDQLVTEPGTTNLAGQVARYIGRVWDDAIHGFPATQTPYECEADSPDGRRLTKLLRRDNCLIPADPATAAACGVEFVPHKFCNGVWEKSSPKPSAAKGDA